MFNQRDDSFRRDTSGRDTSSRGQQGLSPSQRGMQEVALRQYYYQTQANQRAFRSGSNPDAALPQLAPQDLQMTSSGSPYDEASHSSWSLTSPTDRYSSMVSPESQIWNTGHASNIQGRVWDQTTLHAASMDWPYHQTQMASPYSPYEASLDSTWSLTSSMDQYTPMEITQSHRHASSSDRTTPHADPIGTRLESRRGHTGFDVASSETRPTNDQVNEAFEKAKFVLEHFNSDLPRFTERHAFNEAVGMVKEYKEIKGMGILMLSKPYTNALAAITQIEKTLKQINDEQGGTYARAKDLCREFDRINALYEQRK